MRVRDISGGVDTKGVQLPTCLELNIPDLSNNYNFFNLKHFIIYTLSSVFSRHYFLLFSKIVFQLRLFSPVNRTKSSIL